MWIGKDDRLAPASPSRRTRAADGTRWRDGGAWQHHLQLLLYALLILLGIGAIIAGVALLVDHDPYRPSSTAARVADEAAVAAGPSPVGASPVGASPVGASPVGASPVGASPTPGASLGSAAQPAAAAPQPDELAKLQAELQAANRTLAELRARAELARRDLAPAPLAAPSTPPPATPRNGTPSMAPPATGTPSTASPATSQPRVGTAWNDAERTVLARRVPALPRRSPPPAQVMTRSPTANAIPDSGPDAAAPDPPPSHAAALPLDAQSGRAAVPADRPHVFVFYPRGSMSAQQHAAAVAQSLLFSDFAYTGTRADAEAPSQPAVRFFHPQDAAMAAKLAAFLQANGVSFQVQDRSGDAGDTPRGTLDVWLND